MSEEKKVHEISMGAFGKVNLVSDPAMPEDELEVRMGEPAVVESFRVTNGRYSAVAVYCCDEKIFEVGIHVPSEHVMPVNTTSIIYIPKLAYVQCPRCQKFTAIDHNGCVSNAPGISQDEVKKS